MSASSTEQVRARLDHPIVDSDAHILEFLPVVNDYVKEIGGAEIAHRFENTPAVDPVARWSVAGIPLARRREQWIEKNHFWTYPVRNTLDRATAHLPKLLSERLEAIGLDFAIMYPTDGLLVLTIRDDELRRVACRAFNTYFAEMLASFSRQMTPVAMIPMQTPEEAIEELEFAVGNLGYKAAVFQQYAARDVSEAAPDTPAKRLDFFGIDSEYDYDPVWETCMRLGVAATFHGVGTGFAHSRNGSVSNHVMNRLGGTALYSRTSAAMVLGGVTRRFPQLRFACLEGGVSWANDFLPKLVSLFEKRNVKAMEDLDPRNLDRDLLFRLIDEYGDKRTLGALDRIGGYFDRESNLARPDPLNEFEACGAESAQDLVDLFVDSFSIGCEADEANLASAQRNPSMPCGARLRPILGSDIGHFDVSDMLEVLPEAYEAVEKGTIGAEDFRDFSFTNAVRLHGEMNPEFFQDTNVEVEAAKVLGR